MVNKWELVAKVHSSNYRSTILKLLENKVMTPTQIMKETKTKISHVSRTLKQLEEINVIECLTPNVRKSKMFSITKLGKEVIKELD